MKLYNYAWNVRELTRAATEEYAKHPETANVKADVSEGFSKLLNNIRHGKAIDPGTDLDWAALKAEWDGLTDEEQSAAIQEYHAVTGKAVGLGPAFEKGYRAAFDAAIETAVAKVEAEAAADHA